MSKSGPLAVRVGTVRTGLVRQTVSYVGTIHSRQEVMVLARTAGRVASLPVPEGGRAKAGTVLAQIATPEVRARISSLRAEAARAKVDSDFACSLARTDRKLLKAHAISRLKARASQKKCAASRAALRAVRAKLREIKLAARHSTETAPFDGIVLQWVAKPGENIMPGRPILLFGGRRMEVRVMVQEGDLARGIRTGCPVLLMPGSDEELLARVAFVGSRAVGPGRLVEVRIPLKEDEFQRMGLRHGMSVDVDFVLAEQRDALLVPVSAVKVAPQRTEVFVVERRHNHAEAKAVIVSVGIRQGDVVAVTSKRLKAGDLVITSNLDLVRDGVAVYPVREREGAGPKRPRMAEATKP